MEGARIVDAGPSRGADGAGLHARVAGLEP